MTNNNTITAEGIINLLSDLLQEHGRTECVWEMPSNLFRDIRKLHDDAGKYLLAINPHKITLVGLPIIISNNINCIKLTPVNKNDAPIAVSDKIVVSLRCTNCAAPLETMKCDYCGTIHRQA